MYKRQRVLNETSAPQKTQFHAQRKQKTFPEETENQKPVVEKTESPQVYRDIKLQTLRSEKKLQRERSKQLFTSLGLVVFLLTWFRKLKNGAKLQGSLYVIGPFIIRNKYWAKFYGTFTITIESHCFNIFLKKIIYR